MIEVEGEKERLTSDRSVVHRQLFIFRCLEWEVMPGITNWNSSEARVHFTRRQASRELAVEAVVDSRTRGQNLARLSPNWL